jgi:formyl-CoA transferase
MPTSSRWSSSPGQLDLARNPRYAGTAARLANVADLEALLAGWTAGQDATGAVAALQARGIPAHRVDHIDDVVASPQLGAREYFSLEDHPECGVRPLPGVPWLSSLSPMRVSAPAPLLGQHSSEVLARLTSVPAEEK